MHITTEKDQTHYIVERTRTDVSKCIQCGRCSATCPMGREMDILPHRMMWELKNERTETVLAAKSPWICLSCFACEQRCPKSLSPASIMEAVRLAQIRPAGHIRLEPSTLERYDADMPQQALVAAFRKYNK